MWRTDGKDRGRQGGDGARDAGRGRSRLRRLRRADRTPLVPAAPRDGPRAEARPAPLHGPAPQRLPSARQRHQAAALPGRAGRGARGLGGGDRRHPRRAVGAGRRAEVALALPPELRLGRGAGVKRLLRPAAEELPLVLPPAAQAAAPARPQSLAGAGRGAGGHGLVGTRKPSRAARRPRAGGHERPAHPPGRPDRPGARRRACLAPADRRRPQPLPAQPQRLRAQRLPARAGRPHPRGPGPPPRGGRAGDQLRPAARAGPRAVALGLQLAARERRPRHQQVRALPVRLPPRGDPAHPGPGLSSGPGASVPGARGRIMGEGAGGAAISGGGTMATAESDSLGNRPPKRPGPAARVEASLERAIALLYAWLAGNRVTRLPWAVVQTFSRAQGALLSGSMAYYTFLSLVPLLMVAAFVIGTLARSDAQVSNAVSSAVGQLLPGVQGRDVVDQLIGARVAFGILGLLSVAYAGSGFVGSMTACMNRMWNVETGRNPLSQKAFNILIVMLLSTVLLGSVGLTIWIGYAARAVFGSEAGPLYRLLPARRHSWLSQVPGALVGAIGVDLLKRAFALWTERSAGVSALPRSLLSVVLLLIWLGLFAQIVLYGAALNVVLDRRRRRLPLLPDLPAVEADEERERERERDTV